jgi:predicted Fe-S protein YdhL (DUF1289 family)
MLHWPDLVLPPINLWNVPTMLPVKSPCTKVCKLNEDDVCVGCGRTRDEIARYMRASATEKESINARAHDRLSTLHRNQPLR